MTTIPAIEALRLYIWEHFDGSVTAFARENKLDVGELGKIVRGQRGQRMTVRYADKIERATNGIVSLKMWVPVRS